MNEKFLNIFEKFFVNRGYISKKSTNILFVDVIHLITITRNDMKNRLMNMCNETNLVNQIQICKHIFLTHFFVHFASN